MNEVKLAKSNIQANFPNTQINPCNLPSAMLTRSCIEKSQKTPGKSEPEKNSDGTFSRKKNEQSGFFVRTRGDKNQPPLNIEQQRQLTRNNINYCHENHYNLRLCQQQIDYRGTTETRKQQQRKRIRANTEIQNPAILQEETILIEPEVAVISANVPTLTYNNNNNIKAITLA